MENASKALIIAGAILLSILIIALGIYVFNMAKSATSDNALSDVEKQNFNGPFQDYEGSKMGSIVVNLIDKLVSNITQNKEADDRLPDIVYIDSRVSDSADEAYKPAAFGVSKATKDSTLDGLAKDSGGLTIGDKAAEVGLEITSNTFMIVSKSGSTGNTEIGKLRTKIANRHYYQVAMTISPDTGLIDCIFIKY